MAINQYTQALPSLNQPAYTPIPFQEMMQMGQYIQKRYDDSVAATDTQYDLSAKTDFINDSNVKQVFDSVLNDFRAGQSELLDKYKGKTYSSDFQREARKLVSQMAGDSRIKEIAQSKSQFDFDDKMAAQMKAEGKQYYDPRLNGQKYVDENGNLIPYKAGVRALNFEDEIQKKGTALFNAMVQNGSEVNNYGQISTAIKESTRKGSGIYDEAVTWYKQQGMKQADAEKAAAQHITDRFNEFKKREVDEGMLKYQDEKRALAAASQQPTPGVGLPRGIGQDITKVPELENELSNIDLALEGKAPFWKEVGQSFTIAAGLPMSPEEMRKINKNPEVVKNEMLAKARGFLGDLATTHKTDKALLEAYKKALVSSYGARAYNTIGHANNKANLEIGNVFLGSNYQTTKIGKNGKVTDTNYKLSETDIKNASFIGFGTYDPKGNTNVSAEFSLPNGEKVVYSLPAEIANTHLPVMNQMNKARLSTAPVASKETNMLGKDYWATAQDPNGKVYKYIPVRTFEDGVAEVRVVKIPADPSNPYGDISLVEANKAVKSHLQTKGSYAVDEVNAEDIDRFLKYNSDVVPGVKSIALE